MTRDENLLSNCKPMKAVTVTVANVDRLTAAAIGSATFPGVQGTVTPTGLLYVPGLHKNLIFVPKLIEKGLSLNMLKHKCIIESKRCPVMAIPKSGSFYVAECLIVVSDSPAPETVTMIDKKYPNTCGQKPYVLHVTSRIGLQVPRNLLLFELWFGQKPDISHFRIYGCKAYMHDPKQKRNLPGMVQEGLHDRAEECILVGYGAGSTYRLMTKKIRRIVIAL